MCFLFIFGTFCNDALILRCCLVCLFDVWIVVFVKFLVFVFSLCAVFGLCCLMFGFCAVFGVWCLVFVVQNSDSCWHRAAATRCRQPMSASFQTFSHFTKSTSVIFIFMDIKPQKSLFSVCQLRIFDLGLWSQCSREKFVFSPRAEIGFSSNVFFTRNWIKIKDMLLRKWAELLLVKIYIGTRFYFDENLYQHFDTNRYSQNITFSLNQFVFFVELLFAFKRQFSWMPALKLMKLDFFEKSPPGCDEAQFVTGISFWRHLVILQQINPQKSSHLIFSYYSQNPIFNFKKFQRKKKWAVPKVGMNQLAGETI